MAKIEISTLLIVIVLYGVLVTPAPLQGAKPVWNKEWGLARTH